MLATPGIGAQQWQDVPESRAQLHQLGLELALADVHPQLTLWWQQAALQAAGDDADNQLLLGISAFWRHWQGMTLVARQHLQTRDAPLVITEQDRIALELAIEQGQLGVLVDALIPDYPDYDSFKRQLGHLLALSEQAWPVLQKPTLRPGESSAQVPLLRQRLILLGDLPPAADLGSRLYDAELEQAVRSFQRRHGLEVDGVVGPHTYAWLNVTPVTRAQKLIRGMLRTLIADTLAPSYLLVNIPEYRLRLYQNRIQMLESAVIVGTDSRKTPIMVSEITNVVVNPPWHVPRSILEKDIIPKLQRDPGYLQREDFEVLDRGGRVVPNQVWQARLFSGFPYALRQRPGNKSALGAYKFHLTNSNAIYLHDTPAKRLFSRDSRAFSSGCVRVAEAEQLALWLLGEKWNPDRLADLKATQRTRWLKVPAPLPVLMVYWSGWLGSDGLPRFRDDIYGFDQGLLDPFLREQTQPLPLPVNRVSL
ncbi:L,D-transpeptidase family protein [Zobellella aerophila]|uniref:L,D-transpeptidase family protein n=1 Tax=Zobellella aerophila TaxID=870480 RepID=A0ABP6VKP2_9GAMM